MRAIRRWAAWLLALLLLPAACAAEEDVYVHIPGSAGRLVLPKEDAWYDGDPFDTGIQGAVAQVLWDSVDVRSDSGRISVDYISKVIVDYPEGGRIRRVTARYANDSGKSLTGYTVTYQTGADEYYTISYAPRTNTVLEDHSGGKILYRDGGTVTVISADTGETVTVDLDADLPGRKLLEDSLGSVWLHHYAEDEILEGAYTDGAVTLRTGSGDRADTWFLWDEWTGKVTPWEKDGLRSPFSFISPRVD